VVMEAMKPTHWEEGMGLIHIELFATLDLVGQAPGGPDEDPAGFPFGGWQAPLLDEVAGAQVGAAYEGTDALLLGRRTYDIFAAYWPYQEGGEDNEIATLFNSVPKYVASRGRPDLSWAPAARPGPGGGGARGPWPARARGRRGEPGPGAAPLAREALRPSRPGGAPGRARRREEGVRRWRGAHDRPPPRTAGRQSEGHRVPALRARRWHARDGGHERTAPRCGARRLNPPPARWVRVVGGESARSAFRHGVGTRHGRSRLGASLCEQ